MESADTQTQEISSMASSLILDSLEIQGFRGFRHLRIERLGRVNLIVGKNSVGKTALMEALCLYATQGTPSTIWKILEARDEVNFPRQILSTFGQSGVGKPTWAIRHLFHGRRDARKQFDQIPTIRIGVDDLSDRILSIYLTRPDPNNANLITQNRVGEQVEIDSGSNIRLVSRLGEKSRITLRLDKEPSPFPTPEPSTSNCVFISANGLSLVEIVRLWDSIALTNTEQEVIRAMHVIDKRVERMNLLSDPSLGDDQNRIPKVRLSDMGEGEPVPLRSLGDGMNRLFGIALALVNAKDGMLLIDEVENGLHYSVQPDVWKLIFETARNLNVQVFATTHSWDCIEAFQKAAEESQEDGLLIRLAERKGEIISDVFSEEELGIATKGQIELR